MSRLLAALRPPPPSPPTGPGGKPKQPEIPPPTLRLLLGLLGVLLAALSPYLNQFDSTFARQDLYGNLSIGQDEKSWITVAFDSGSVAIVVLTAWLSIIVSPRRVVAGFLILQTLAAVTAPTMTSYAGLVALAFLHGVGGGALVPMLFTVLLRVLPPYDRSNVIASDATAGAFGTVQGEAAAGGLSGLSSEVHRQAYVMAYTDAYGWTAMIMIAGIVVLLFVGEAPVARRPRKEPKGKERMPGPEPQPAE